MDNATRPGVPQDGSAGPVQPYSPQQAEVSPSLQPPQPPGSPDGNMIPQAPDAGQYLSSAPQGNDESQRDAQYPHHEPAPTPQQSVAVHSRGVIITSALTLVGVTLIGVGFTVGGEPRKFIEIGIQFIPLAILAALAYAGVKNSAAAVFAYIWLGIVALGVLFNSFGSVLIAEMQPGFSLSSANSKVTNLSQVFQPGAAPALLWTMLLLTLATVISLLALLRPVRVLFARIMPIDPDNFVHKIALSVLLLILISSFIPLIVLGGRPPLLEFVKNGGANNLGSQAGGDVGLSVRPIDLVYQFIWTIPATFVAAGWPVARSFGAMLKRVGFVRPTLLQVAAGLGLGLGLAVVSTYLIDPGINALWNAMGWGTTDTAAFSQLMSKVITPLGAVLIGVTAGVGEELAVRGLLQPRIGLIASNLVFTSLHAFQYGVDGLLSVFIIGAMLGVIRMRSNTSTSAIVHGVYDFVLVLMSFYAGQ